MAKETLSPKVKRADRHTRRGQVLGDKPVKRHKARGTGVQHLTRGNTLMDGIREDKAAQRRPRQEVPHKPFRQRFTERLGQRVVGSAKKNHWSSATCQQARVYVRALVAQPGNEITPPEELRGRPLRDVQWHFAMVAAQMNPSPGSFAGQDADWYEATLKQARNKRASWQLAAG